MTRPPDDLFKWPKKALVQEVERLRAITREFAERRGGDPRESATTGAIIGGQDDPYGSGNALIDARGAVLLDSTDVALVDSADQSESPVFAVMTLAGRINYADDRVENAYMFDADGAAAISTQLIGLGARAYLMGEKQGRPDAMKFGVDFRLAFEHRMGEMP